VDREASVGWDYRKKHPARGQQPPNLRDAPPQVLHVLQHTHGNYAIERLVAERQGGNVATGYWQGKRISAYLEVLEAEVDTDVNLFTAPKPLVDQMLSSPHPDLQNTLIWRRPVRDQRMGEHLHNALRANVEPVRFAMARMR